MTSHSGNGSVPSLNVLVRLRQVEETRSLMAMNERHAALESQRQRILDLREESAEILRQMESQGSSGEDAARRLLQRRKFLEALRGRESEAEKAMEQLERDCAKYEGRYSEARSRRRVSESLRQHRLSRSRAGTKSERRD